MIFTLAQEVANQSGSGWNGFAYALLAALVAAGIPSAVAGWINAKRKKLEAELGAVVEGVEAIPDEGTRSAAKASIKRTTLERGVATGVDDAVQKRTRRL